MNKKEFNVWIIAVLCLICLGLLKIGAYPYTKIYIGEDNNALIYGVQSEVEFVKGIKYYGEVETWLATDRESFRGWQIQKVAYTLELTYDNLSLVHECQHYLDKVDDWDSQNYIKYRIDLPGNTDRRK